MSISYINSMPLHHLRHLAAYRPFPANPVVTLLHAMNSLTLMTLSADMLRAPVLLEFSQRRHRLGSSTSAPMKSLTAYKRASSPHSKRREWLHNQDPGRAYILVQFV